MVGRMTGSASQAMDVFKSTIINIGGGGWVAEGNWIRRPRRGARRVQDGQPKSTKHQILLLTITDRPLWSINR